MVINTSGHNTENQLQYFSKQDTTGHLSEVYLLGGHSTEVQTKLSLSRTAAGQASKICQISGTVTMQLLRWQHAGMDRHGNCRGGAIERSRAITLMDALYTFCVINQEISLHTCLKRTHVKKDEVRKMISIPRSAALGSMTKIPARKCNKILSKDPACSYLKSVTENDYIMFVGKIYYIYLCHYTTINIIQLCFSMCFGCSSA